MHLHVYICIYIHIDIVVYTFFLYIFPIVIPMCAHIYGKQSCSRPRWVSTCGCIFTRWPKIGLIFCWLFFACCHLLAVLRLLCFACCALLAVLACFASSAVLGWLCWLCFAGLRFALLACCACLPYFFKQRSTPTSANKKKLGAIDVETESQVCVFVSLCVYVRFVC